MVKDLTDDFLFGEDIEVDSKYLSQLRAKDKRSGPKVQKAASEKGASHGASHYMSFKNKADCAFDKSKTFQM